MPYETPTATQFKERFAHDFDSLDDAYIDVMIAEAARNVDTGWEVEDYQPAIMYLAAHNIAEEKSLGGISGAPGMIISSKLGDGSDTYAQNQSVDATSIYGGTVYGRRYAQLLRLNAQAVILL